MMRGILLVLLSLLPWHGDRHESARAERLWRLAWAIDVAAERSVRSGEWTGSRRELAALLIVQGYWESRFARHIHAGRCGPLECDPYRYQGQLLHRATSPWQIQFSGVVPPSEWRTLAGEDLESTTRAATAAARVLSRGRSSCRSLEGTIAAYAGVRCRWSGARARARHVRTVEAELRHAAP